MPYGQNAVRSNVLICDEHNFIVTLSGKEIFRFFVPLFTNSQKGWKWKKCMSTLIVTSKVFSIVRNIEYTFAGEKWKKATITTRHSVTITPANKLAVVLPLYLSRSIIHMVSTQHVCFYFNFSVSLSPSLFLC